VGLSDLLDVLDLAADTEGALALAFASRTDSLSFELTTLPPAESGSVRASMLGDELASASYTVARSEAVALEAVLRTSTVYRSSDGVHDRNSVMVAIQVRDASGNSRVLTSGLSVKLTLSDDALSASTASASCSVDSTTGLGSCEVEVPSGWFSEAATGSASATVALSYSGQTSEVSVSAGTVVLASPPSHSSLSESGMTLALPESPRFAGDSLDATLTASLLGVSYGLMAWTISINYDTSVLSLQSYTVDSIWGSVTESVGDGTVGLLMNCPSDCSATNTEVQGSNIPILTARLQVLSSASAGTYTDAVSVDVTSMLNFGNNFIVEGGSAHVLDGRSGGSSEGELQVEVSEDVGLFAYAPSGIAVLANTAPVTGSDVSVGAIGARRVTSRPHDSSFYDVSATCSSSSSAVSLAGCSLSLPASAADGGEATVAVSYDELSASVRLMCGTHRLSSYRWTMLRWVGSPRARRAASTSAAGCVCCRAISI
jgi:hypothetical protein